MTMELAIAQLKMLIIGTEVLSNFKSSTPDRSNGVADLGLAVEPDIKHGSVLLTSMPTVGKL